MYHIHDGYTSKEFFSSISWRVTTYKPRLVLKTTNKKKGGGLYNYQSSNIDLIHHNSNTHTTVSNSITTYTHLLANIKHDIDLEEQLTTTQTLLNVTQKILSHGMNDTTKTNHNNSTNNSTSKRSNGSLLFDQTVINLNNVSRVITSDLQNATQAAINGIEKKTDL